MKLAEFEGVFVTGTDTHIGKTYVSALILEELREHGRKVIGLKPVSSGDREDAQKLWQAAGGGIDLEVVNPVVYRTPVAPYTAGQLEGPPLVLEAMVTQITQAREGYDFTLVEGAGGWEVPLGKGFGIPDLAREVGLPVVVVVANWLGAINHALLTVKAIEQAGLQCAGVILNHPVAERDVAAVTNRAILDELLPFPILGEVMTDGDRIDWED
jgi:dethiobiotin synthetase